MLNYYLEIKHKFDKNVAIVGFVAVLSFMIRCTSVIGWIPLVLYKVVVQGSFCAFFLSGLIVGLPALCLFIAIDSIYYEDITFVAYNFL